MEKLFAPAEVSLDIDSINVTEDSGEEIEYIFTRDGDTTDPLTVNFTVDSSAIFDTDYKVEGAVIDGTTGEVIIAAGESEATVSITPIVDSDIESDETVKLSLAEGDYIFEDSQDEDVMLMGTITNDDPQLNVDWVNQFSGDNYSTDYLAVDDDGNTYVTGSFEGTVTLGDDTLTAGDSSDVFVAKLDKDGNVLRADSFGGDDSDFVEDIAVDDDGNTYFTGTFSGTAIFGDESLEGSEDGDVFVAKLNSDGDVIWALDFGNTNDDEYVSAIDLDSEGNLYITGEFEEAVNFGSTTLEGAEEGSVFIAKLDGNNGDAIWANEFNAIDDQIYSSGIVADDEGNTYIAGDFYETATFGSETLEGGEESDIFVAKLDNQGDVLWAENFGDTDYEEYLSAIDIDDENNIYIAAEFEETLQFGSETLEGGENGDVFVAKLNSEGDVIWAEDFNSEDDDVENYVEVESIAVDDMGNTYVTGYYEGDSMNISDFMLKSEVAEDDEAENAFIAKFDTGGEVKWAQNIGGSQEDAIYDIAINDGKIYIAGGFYEEATFSDEILTTDNFIDTFLVKLEEEKDKSEITLSVDSNTIGEGDNNQITYTFTRKGEINAALTVEFSVTSKAIFNQNYTLKGTTNFDGTKGTVVFEAGKETATVILEVTDDASLEVDEVFDLKLVEGSSYQVSETSIPENITIKKKTDDDRQNLNLIIKKNQDDSKNSKNGGNVVISTGPISGITIKPQLSLKSQNKKTFAFQGNDTQSSIKFSFKSTSVQEIREIAYFTVDDDEGNIDGISPDEEGYTQAALNRSLSIISFLGNLPQGFDTNLSSSITFEEETRFRLLSVNGGTLKGVKAGKIQLSQVNISSDSSLNISEIGDNTFDLGIEGVSLEMKLDDEVTTTIGTKLQKSKQLQVLDLREETIATTATFTINRDAEFDNFVGFFNATDEEGGIDTNGDGMADILVGEAGYAEAAVQNRIAGIDLSVANQATASFTGELSAGAIIVPFIIVDGSTDAFSDDDASNNPDIFFPFIGANSDGEDHIIMLADNTFGFEDLVGGGDRDFNDITAKVDFAPIST